MADALTIPTVPLADGTAFPEIGLGTYKLDGNEGAAAVGSAIDIGYRLLDTAVNYGNEDAVGRAVREASVPRDALLIVSKVPGRDHGTDETRRSVEGSLERLGLDRIDLQLIHWPNPSVDRYVETFQTLLSLRDEGRIGAAGVSNFTIGMLTRLHEETGEWPVVNQVELHPYFPQGELRAFHAGHGIRTESWSPLARRSELLSEPVIGRAAALHDATPTQVVVRWHTQLGSTPIPKSSTPERQRENADVFGFTLSHDEVAAISALERGRLWGADPETHEEQ